MWTVRSRLLRGAVVSGERQGAFNAFLRGITPVLAEHGFKRQRANFVRESDGLGQRVQCRRHMDLEDQFWIEMYLWIEYRPGSVDAFGRLIQSFSHDQSRTALFEPFDSEAVGRAVGWHSDRVVHQILPLADRLFDVDRARAYDWVHGAFRDDGVSLQVFVPAVKGSR